MSQNDKSGFSSYYAILAEIITSGLGATYFFTLGYLHSLGLPVMPSPLESASFFTNVIAASSTSTIWSLFTSPITFAGSCVVLGLSLSYKAVAVKKIRELTVFLDQTYKRTALGIVGLLLFLIAGGSCVLRMIAENAKIYSLIGDSFGHFIFGQISVLAIVFVPLLIFVVHLYEKQGALNKKVLACLVLSAILTFGFSYRIAFHFSGKFMKFPELLRDSSSGAQVLVWTSSEVKYWVECAYPRQSMIVGLNNDGKKVFETILYYSNSPSVCARD